MQAFLQNAGARKFAQVSAREKYLIAQVWLYMAMIFFNSAQDYSFSVVWIVVWIGPLMRTLVPERVLKSLDRFFFN